MSLLYKIPNNYVKARQECAKPGVLQGLDHFYYLNTDEIITDGDFSNWRLALYDSSWNQISSNFATLNKDQLPDANNYRVYFTFKIDISLNLAGKTLIFVIYENSGNTVKYVFNPIKVLDHNEAARWTYVQYRNSRNIFNYNYEDTDVYGVNTYNNIFLFLNRIEDIPEYEIEPYRALNTGKRRNIQSEISKAIKFESYYFDEGLHDLMIAISMHDDILINGKDFELKTPYTIEPNPRNKQQKGVIELYDQTYSKINYYG